MSEEFINDYGKHLYYLNEIKEEENLVCFRIVGKIKINRIVSSNSKDDEQLINEEFDEINDSLCKYIFYINEFNLVLSKSHIKSDNKDSNLKTCSDLFTKTTSNIEETLRNYLSIEILKSVTVSSSDSIISPIFTNHKGISSLNIYELPIDILVFCNKKLNINEIYFVFFQKLKLHIETIKQCYLTFYKNEKHFIPETYHYWHRDWNPHLLLTIVWPSNRDDSQLKIIRENIHKTLNLSLNRPYFRRDDAFTFNRQEVLKTNNGGSNYLMNPHLEVKPSGLKDGKQTLVKGNYFYYHYMQDGFNDNGWGCAYRSLQTIFSWYKLQSYTLKEVPTHRQIQQTLVDIGDKSHKFIGSSEWIGSMEISFCLNKLLGIDSKILNVSKGSELVEKVRELEYHFESEGTPVMIGGGAYAYTILGVDFNESTGEVKYLVLDPHYVGSDELKTVVNKGWCGWKASSFWNQTSYYNLCLPLRNNMI